MSKELLQLREVAARTEELKTLTGRFREGWANRDARQRFVLTVVWTIGLAALAAAVALPGVARFIAAVTGLVGPFLGLMIGVLKPSGEARRAGVRILGAEEESRRESELAKAAYEHAKQKLDDLRNAGPAGLYGFVEARYLAEDYRKYLGMVPLIRKDLKRLSDQGGTPDAAIERVVLYIDDLDRCPTSQVVKVLEAVNLLFALPLFVVVIEVDSRWLVRSLKEEFPVFAGDGTDAPSPQDYLEKIIQIPFWLRRMDPDGFGGLVSGLP